MPAMLLVLFLFQGGLAFAFSYFVCTMVLADEDGFRTAAGIVRKVRGATVAFSVLFPPLLYFVFLKSLPEDKPASLAFWPALWMLILLLSVALALSIALKRSAAKLELS
ncbi:MAG: hypothetical protein GVY10_12555 [Verrucomicrobia bacterium]|jgi:hypothetical protein|nr:hypothetical protein [Verrucomicrobiota bacterium]